MRLGATVSLGSSDLGRPMIPESASGSRSDPERAAGVAVLTIFVVIEWTWRAAQHFTETPGLDALAATEWTGTEFHRGLLVV